MLRCCRISFFLVSAKKDDMVLEIGGMDADDFKFRVCYYRVFPTGIRSTDGVKMISFCFRYGMVWAYEFADG